MPETHHPAPPAPLDYGTPASRPDSNYARAFGRLIGVVFLSCFVFAIFGGLLGLVLGLAVPDYYRGVFPASGADPAFSPIAVGLGLGASQGAALGAFVGLALTFILAWRETRIGRAG